MKAVKVAPEKVNKLDTILSIASECNKALGVEGKVFVDTEHKTYERLPTGILAFDVITGGGLVREHLVELYGEDSSAKTLIALNAVASAQRKGLTAVWVQGEEFDPDWAERQGVDLKKLIRIQTTTGDRALETAITIVEEGNPDLMVLDSYQALGTSREAESGVDSESYAGGGAPQLWGRFYRRTRGAFNGKKATTALLGISQVRAPIGMFSPNGHPEPKPTQIWVLRHWKAISVLCKKGEPVYSDPKSERKKLLAKEFHLKCVKNKTSASDRVSSFWYTFQEHEGKPFGVDHAESVMRLGKVQGLLRQNGGWIQGYDLRAQGDAEFLKKLRENAKVMNELHTDVLSSVKAGGSS